MNKNVQLSQNSQTNPSSTSLGADEEALQPTNESIFQKLVNQVYRDLFEFQLPKTDHLSQLEKRPIVDDKYWQHDWCFELGSQFGDVQGLFKHSGLPADIDPENVIEIKTRLEQLLALCREKSKANSELMNLQISMIAANLQKFSRFNQDEMREYFKGLLKPIGRINYQKLLPMNLQNAEKKSIN